MAVKLIHEEEMSIFCDKCAQCTLNGCHFSAHINACLETPLIMPIRVTHTTAATVCPTDPSATR